MQAPQSSSQTQVVIMMPSKVIPQNINQFIADTKDKSIRFINGYRNIIIKSDKEISWGLVPSQDHCGQAYCYLLKSNVNLQSLLSTQLKNNQKITKVGDQMIVIQSSQSKTHLDNNLSSNQVKILIQQITQAKQQAKIGINLLKNAFDSFDQYSKWCKQGVQKFQSELKSEVQQTLPTVAETLLLEQNAKKLEGDNSRKLPKCNLQTGQWNDQDIVQMHLSTQ